MSNREFYNRRMAEIGQPIDLENDPFSNLFVDKKKNKEMDLSDIRQPEVPENETHKPRYKPIEQKYNRDLERQDKEGAAVYLLLPVASVAVTIAFLTGLFGGTFLLEKLVGGDVEVAEASNPMTLQSQNRQEKEVKTATALPQKPDTKIIPQIAAGILLPSKPLSKSLAKSRPKPVTGELSSGRVETASVAVTAAVPLQASQPPTARQQANRQPVSPVITQPEKQINSMNDPQSQVARLLRDGYLLEEGNDFSGARVKFRQAFGMGSNVAALAIARTYDGRRTNPGDNTGDVKLAREWYEKWFLAALAKGDISPRARYDRLLSGLKEN